MYTFCRKWIICMVAFLIGIVSISCSPEDSLSMDLVVRSDSMKPAFAAGETITVYEVDASSLQVGDIIAFNAVLDGEDVIVTHRIFDVICNENGSGVSYYTKGDNNDLIDQDPLNAFPLDPVEPDQVIGLWTGDKVSCFRF